MGLFNRSKFRITSEDRTGFAYLWVNTPSGRVNPLTKEEALELSIEKWRVIAEYIGKHRELVHRPTAGSCGLCALYYGSNPSIPDCSGCPVFLRTGQIDCCGSPFRDYETALHKYDMRKPDTFRNGVVASERAAWEEVRFLESLRG